MGPVAKMAALEARARGRVVAVIPRPEASSAPRMPHWQGHYCALPNALLRSATFAAIGKGQRVLLSGALVESQAGIGVLYSGEQLDQSDLDVWIALLQLLQNQPLDQRLETSTYALLKRLGVLDTGPNRTSLKRRIQRLSNCALSIHSASCMYEGGLTGVECLDDKPLALRLNPTIIRLFRDDQFTLVDLRVVGADGKLTHPAD